ncbi:MAG: acyl-CoA dehydrogenase family protein [Solirubrobacteraceae bacterium]
MSVSADNGVELYDDDHRAFRESFDTFLARRVVPVYPDWRGAGQIPRELFAQAAADGFLGMGIPEQFGGAGVEDPRFGIVVAQQAMLAGVPALALALSSANDVVVPALLRDGTEAQQGALLSRLADATIVGTVVVADVAITDAPSPDPAGPPGHVVLDGSASYVVQGIDAELLVIVGRSEAGVPRAALANSRKPGFTVTASDPGFGLQAAGLADIGFDGAPGQALGSGPGVAQRVLLDLQLSLAVSAVAGARAALALATDYVLDRKAFGQPIAAFENTRQMLGEVAANIDAAQAFVELGIRERLSGALQPSRAAALKLHCTELFGAAVDAGVQLHGGYGYIMEYPIAHAYADARFWRLYGGTSQEMKDIVAASFL